MFRFKKRINYERKNAMKPDSAKMRKRAEDLLKKKNITGTELSETDTLRLIHELEVHQIELELQNEELIAAKELAEAATDKYIELYDFAPACYFTLNRDGKIAGLNLMASQLIGKERERLINSRFDFYVSDGTRHKFNTFFEELLQSNTRKMCEVILTAKNQPPKNINLTCIVTGNGEHCLLTAVDITERKNAEAEIGKLLEEKNLLLKEVHHRIKNNMNTIRGLVSLQVISSTNPSTISALQDTESRIKSMVLLYDKLYSSGNYREMSVKDYLVPLARDIVNCFPDSGKITIKTEVDDIIMSFQSLSPLGIIVNELITNMMKYAFIGRDSGVISITAAMKDCHVEVSIRDDGNGIPESVNFENSTGFGMGLVGLLTEQIDGSIRIERGEGTKFILELDV